MCYCLFVGLLIKNVPDVLVRDVIVITYGIIDVEQGVMAFDNFPDDTVFPIKIVEVFTQGDEKLGTKPVLF